MVIFRLAFVVDVDFVWARPGSGRQLHVVPQSWKKFKYGTLVIVLCV